MNFDKDGFGMALKSIRKKLGLTIEEACFIAGINEKTLYRIEYGKNNITMNTLDKLSIAYKMDLFDIYNEYMLDSKTKLLNLINKAEKSIYVDDLENIEACINHLKKFPLNKLPSYKEISIKHYIRLLEATYVDLKYSDRTEAIKILINSIKSEINDFDISNYKNFNYSPIEKRILMNISTMKYDLDEDKIFIEILNYLSTLLEDNIILYPKIILNLAAIYHVKEDYDKCLNLTKNGIDYCIKNKNFDIMPKFFFRKFTTEAILGMKDYKDTLKKAVFMAEINNQEYLKRIFINSAKNFYNTSIDE